MEPEESQSPSTADKPALSRRDFLRSAGREAAQTGARLVPGANLVAGNGERPWWRRLADWRNQRTADPDPPSNKDEDTPDAPANP